MKNYMRNKVIIFNIVIVTLLVFTWLKVNNLKGRIEDNEDNNLRNNNIQHVFDGIIKNSGKSSSYLELLRIQEEEAPLYIYEYIRKEALIHKLLPCDDYQDFIFVFLIKVKNSIITESTIRALKFDEDGVMIEYEKGGAKELAELFIGVNVEDVLFPDFLESQFYSFRVEVKRLCED